MNSDALFRNYYRPLCIYALHYLLDVEQVEDVVQDCFVRLLEIGDEPQNARGWLYTAVRNRCIDQLRRKNPLLTNIQQTLYMVGWALLIGTIIGFILALALVLTRKGGILKGTGARIVHAVLNFYVNVVRSVPFVILLVTIMPFTRLLMGTTIGSTAALVPLVLYISPYLARLIENSLLECSPGIIEAAQAMGANVFQVIRYFLIPETLGSVVLALTTGTIGLLGASAMAGYVGGGGVGDLALTYGYEKMNTPLMILTVIILIVIVQLIQLLGGAISAKLREHQS